MSNTLAYCIALSLIEIYTSKNSSNCGLHLFCRRKWLKAEYSTTTYWNGALCLLLVKASRWQLWKGSHFNLNIKSEEKKVIYWERVLWFNENYSIIQGFSCSFKEYFRAIGFFSDWQKVQLNTDLLKQGQMYLYRKWWLD